jgi:hypothetical protein
MKLKIKNPACAEASADAKTLADRSAGRQKSKLQFKIKKFCHTEYPIFASCLLPFEFKIHA